MKKLLVISLLLGIGAMPLLAADTAVGGVFILGHYLSQTEGSTGIDYGMSKGEVYLKNDAYVIEMDIMPSPPAVAAGKQFVLDQAYAKVPLAGGELMLGLYETGIGNIVYSASATQGSLLGEIEGLGFLYSQDVGDMKVKVGNYGTLLADATKSSADRGLFATVTTTMAGLTVEAGGLMTTDSSAEKSNIAVIAEAHYKMDVLSACGMVEYTVSDGMETGASDVSLLGVGVKYEVMAGTNVYGTYGMGLNDETKANLTPGVGVGSDLIIGASHQLSDATKAVVEYKTTKLNDVETNADLLVGAVTVF